ncbi:MAG: cation:proton antiporter [Muribaculum sp.]|nr:cation:proton antiporter [Muribaculum sp.]
MNILKLHIPLVTDPVLIFFIVLVIILLAPIILNRLKIPHIIGMIVAGIAIGPHGIDLLNRDASFEIFGQVGILYLMFLAGIEIDMYHLQQNIRKGFSFGLMTFIIPLFTGTICSVMLLNVDWLTAILLASMFASHTLIAYPVVSRFELTKSPTVITAIAGTIVAVLGSLIVLGSVVSVATRGYFSFGTLAWLLVKLAIYSLIIIYTFPRLTKWFFRKFADNVTQFIYVLALVFLASITAKMIGLESVLGAFFAGVILNRYIPATSALKNRIEFVGNAIFIPYFLIGVGMLINIKVLVSGWSTIYTAAAMSLIAIVGKWLPAIVTQKIYGMTRTDRMMLFGLTNAHAAVALAAVMIGYNIGIINETIINGTVVMILVTCIVSSLVTENAAARMKMDEVRDALESGDDGTPKIDRRIHSLVSVPNPVIAPALVDFAMMLRGPYWNHSTIYALHVRNDNTPGSRAIGRNALDVAVKTGAATDTRIIPIERYDLNVATGLLNTIEERDITDVIMGLHRKANIIDSFYGSKTEQLLKSTNRMVVMSRLFIPLSTVNRIVVYVPQKAEFETGFRRWVISLGNLAANIGCRIVL